MKIICAWCKKLIGYKCPLCGSALTQDPNDKSRLICQSGETAIHFGTEGMTETHGICEDCRAQIKPEDIANLEQQLEKNP